MGLMYQNRCYSDIYEVENILLSYPKNFIATSSNYGGKSDPYVLDATTFQVDETICLYCVHPTFIYDHIYHDYILPTCGSIGQVGTDLGITFDDGQLLAWLLVTLMVTAFSIKILKRLV